MNVSALIQNQCECNNVDMKSQLQIWYSWQVLLMHILKQTVHYLLHPNKSSGSIPSASDIITPKRNESMKMDSNTLSDISYAKEKGMMETRSVCPSIPLRLKNSYSHAARSPHKSRPFHKLFIGMLSPQTLVCWYKF